MSLSTTHLKETIMTTQQNAQTSTPEENHIKYEFGGMTYTDEHFLGLSFAHMSLKVYHHTGVDFATFMALPTNNQTAILEVVKKFADQKDTSLIDQLSFFKNMPSNSDNADRKDGGRHFHDFMKPGGFADTINNLFKGIQSTEPVNQPDIPKLTAEDCVRFLSKDIPGMDGKELHKMVEVHGVKMTFIHSLYNLVHLASIALNKDSNYNYRQN